VVHAASSAASSVTGGALAVVAATQLAASQPSGIRFGTIGRAMNNLGAAMLDDASGRMGGVPGHQFGTHGGRATARQAP
jgi:hypothetical protein